MNELIKELAEQAGFEADSQKGQYGNMTLSDHLEKLAELIIRECALVARTLPHTPERHWILDSVTHIPVHCEQNILKHFGVKP